MIKFLIALFVFTIINFSAYANDLCQKVDDVYIEIHYNIPNYRILNNKNFNEIATINNRPIIGNYKQTGLTNAVGDYSIKTSFKYQIHNTYYCISVNKVDIYIGYQFIDVYIPNQYKPGSCEYNEVLKHELEHVEILTKGIYNNKLNIENNISNIISNFKMPIITKDLENTKNLMNDSIKNSYKYLISNMNIKIQNKNSSIDTSSNYSNIARKCKNW